MSIESLGRLWQTAGRNGSSHYGVNGTQVGQYVKEDAVAWTDGNWESNKKSVTIETANSTSAPNWEVSDTTLNTLIKLVADIARRNKLGTLVVGQNLTYHSMYSATACPGPYLLSKMQEIADGANAINGEYSIGVQEKIYLRKTGTDKYLGFIEKEVDGNETINEAAYVDKDLATGFLMTGENGIFTLCDFDNQNLKLQMRASDGKAILAGEEVVNVPVFAEYNDDYNINIFCNNTVSQSMMRNSDVSIFKQFFSILEDSLGFLFGNKDDFGVVKVGESPVVEYLTGYVPENLLNKVVRIKYKVTGEYLNYIDENSPDIGIKNLIISNVESNISNQLFKIVQVGHKGYVITPVKDNNKSITVTYKNISTAETMDAFSNDYLISVFPKNDYYTIYFPQKNKYLSKGTLLGAPIAIGSSIENLWEIEEYDPFLNYITVDGWMRLYREPLPPLNYDYEQIEVEIPCEDNGLQPAFIDKTRDGYDIVYKFTDKSRWYGAEGYLSSEKISSVGHAQIVKWSGKEPIVLIQDANTSDGAIVDENKNYGVAVGPKVLHSEYPDNGNPGQDGENIYPMYYTGKIDAVLSDDEGNIYYLPCVVGDIKAHTHSNGVVQTWYGYGSASGQDTYVEYEHAESHPQYAHKIYDSLSCIEFIMNDDFATTMYFSNKEETLGRYKIENIIYYKRI